MKENNWLYVSPIFGVEIAPDLNEEFKICRVTLISGKKLRKSNSRFYFRFNSKDFKDHPSKKVFFDKYNYFAILKFSGEINSKRNNLERTLQRELDFLRSSLLNQRRQYIINGITTEERNNHLSIPRVCISQSKPDLFPFSISYERDNPLIIDEKWIRAQESSFFLKLLNYIRNKKRYDNHWLATLRRATELIGKAQSSNILSYCFLNNMIVIEMLLKNNDQEKFMKVIPGRVEAFFDWSKALNSNPNKRTGDLIENKLKAIYDKRNNLVHQGEYHKISIEDLLFSDELVRNLMSNIMHHISIFRNQQALISFCEIRKAQKVLKLKKTNQPGSLFYVVKNYSASRIRELEQYFT